MANRRYTTRESVKGYLEAVGVAKNPLIDNHIDAATETIERELRRRFIPFTATKKYNWPQENGQSGVLHLDHGLISLSGLTSQNGAVTVNTGEVFLEPVNEGPPYTRIELDKASTDANTEFAAGESTQRAIAVTGSWGDCADTVTAGTVTSGLASSASATSMVCSDGSLIGVGDTLLIESEQLFVSERTAVSGGVGALLGADFAANTSARLLELATPSTVFVGEVLLVDSEKMLVEAVSADGVTVTRAYDGTTLAAHSTGAQGYTHRQLTVVRGVNGTTAATHANSTAMSKYQPPADIQALCRAEAIFNYEQDESGHTGVVGGVEGGVNVRPKALSMMWESARCKYLTRLAMVL
jgi:hypothetical protein